VFTASGSRQKASPEKLDLPFTGFITPNRMGRKPASEEVRPAKYEEGAMAQTNQEFERLKQKYQPVINLMKQLQVQVQNVNMEGTKLLIRGVAPSAEAKNKVWDQIKLIDATFSDLTCDIGVSQQQPQPATMTAGASVSGGQNQRRYTVKSGDTLSSISRQFYGDANQYMKILNANRGVLQDPNKIVPGQELVIPE
jgi:nucleoid-associated protein YgaU